MHHIGNNNHEKARLELDSSSTRRSTEFRHGWLCRNNPMLPVSVPAPAMGTCTLARAQEKNGSSTRQSGTETSQPLTDSEKPLRPRDETTWILYRTRDYYTDSRYQIALFARSLRVVLVHVAATLALRGGAAHAHIHSFKPIPSLCCTPARLPSPALQQAWLLVWHVARAGHHGKLVLPPLTN